MTKRKSGETKQESSRRFSQEQYDMLLRCSEKRDFTEWNNWREKDLTEEVNLEGVNLQGAYLKVVNLTMAYLKDAYLVGAWLDGTVLVMADLNGAVLNGSRLEGTSLFGSSLKGASFRAAVVDGSTLLEGCSVDRNTDFRSVGLANCRIDSGTKHLLEYNIRRMNWEDWYKKHKVLKWMVRPFWWMSDYGMSTARVVGVFFILAFLFAAVYMNWAYWRPPGIVSNLVVQPEMGEAAWHYFLRASIRPVYFSIVTMTTLGFGDMYANKGSIGGHVILAVQVILGYVLLGALVTRFAVLFTAGGPAGTFSKGNGKGEGVGSRVFRETPGGYHGRK